MKTEIASIIFTHQPERTAPIQHYARFLPALAGRNILSFDLQETKLCKVDKLASWLGVKECYLKLELSHPTGTVKDRVTEVVYSLFQNEGITEYSHCSTGNTGTSLVWGLSKIPKPFSLTMFIPEKQLAHHNFKKVPGLITILLKNADYEEAKKYWIWFVRNIAHQPEYLSFSSEWRRQANKIPYLEAYEQIGKEKAIIDFVVQVVSDGTGIVAAEMAAHDAMAEGWLSKKPAFVVTQPVAANPIVKCFKKGFKNYNSLCTLSTLKPSKAFAIRRKDAGPYYKSVYEVIKHGGTAIDATEKEIKEAKQKLLDLEKIDAGFTACTSLAAIKKENNRSGFFKNKSTLVMLTGIDRPTNIIPKIDQIIPEWEWRKVLRNNKQKDYRAMPGV